MSKSPSIVAKLRKGLSKLLLIVWRVWQGCASGLLFFLDAPGRTFGLGLPSTDVRYHGEQHTWRSKLALILHLVNK